MKARTLILLGLLGCAEPKRDFLNGGGSGAAKAHTLFLAFDGATLSPGTDDATHNSSSLVRISATFKGYDENDPQRAAHLDDVTADVSSVLAPYDIVVTRVRPPSAPYAMIVFTDDLGTVVGCPNCISLSPQACNTEKSPVGFMFGGAFGGGQFTPTHLASSNAITMFGLFAAIPATARPGDCMCYSETPCIEAQMTMSSACTIGGPGTPVSVVPSCPTTLTTVDENAEFLAAFGPAM